MKRIFYWIGLLLVVFSMSQYIIVAETMVYYLNDDDTYVVTLEEKSMPIDEMDEIATDCDVTFFNREIQGRGIGSVFVKFSVLNPSDNIKEGIEKTVFKTGEKEIVFMDKYNTKEFKQIFIVTNDEENYNNVIKEFINRGYEVRNSKLNKVTVSIDMLFSGPLIKFFVLIGVLSVIAIVSYYVFRLKEIGILSLNGWTSGQISKKIMFDMLKNMFIGFFIPLFLMVIYVLLNNYRIINNLLFISTAVFIFQSVICLCSCSVGTIMIKKINYVSAIKNRKNNKKFFAFLMLAKVVTIFLLFMEINSLAGEIINGAEINKAFDVYKSIDLYRVEQREPLGESTFKLMRKEIQKLSDSEVYYYDYYEEDYVMSSLQIKELEKTEGINDINNGITCSYNFVPILKVKDTFGRYINNIDVTGKGKVCVLLVPYHYASNILKIKEEYKENYDTIKIMYIQNNQQYMNYKSPGMYNYDSIIVVTDIIKETSSSVFLTKFGKIEFENILDANNIADSTLLGVSLIEYYNESKAVNEMQLLRNIIYITLAIISYMIVAFTIVTIYFELRKKQIGVYMLQGRYPVGHIILLPIMNMIVVTVFAIIMNKYLLVVNVVELVIYVCLLIRYLKNKAILAIKGE